MPAMKSKKPSAPLRPSEPGRYFRLTYSNAWQDDEPKLFKERDAIAFCELTACLPEMGFHYGTTIHLYPDDERKLSEFPAFRPGDLLVLSTRPPLHDQVGIVPPHRKIIRAAKTELEVLLFRELSKYFEYCTRKHVELTTYAASLLRVEEPHKWKHTELYEYSGAKIMSHYVGPEPVKPKPNRCSSIAFFLRINQVPKLNCDFIASFGMDGYGTLIWNRMIRNKFAHWLASPGFVMAELIFKNPLNPIPLKPLTPEFNDDRSCVEVRLLT